jgi:hypothetical protein
VQTLANFGISLKDIESALQITYRQACYAASAPQVTPKKRAERPPTVSEGDVDEIEIFVVGSQTGRLMSYAQLFLVFSHLGTTEERVKLALQKRGYHRRVARQKPPLKDHERLAFANAHKDWTRERWCPILWSDESWVQGSRHRKQ